MSRRWTCPKLMIESRIKLDDKGCWIWQGFLNQDGYVHIPDLYWSKVYKVTKGHQLSYVVYKGEYDRKLCIRHSCHNRACINPQHLTTGTHQQNMDDMLKAGRKYTARGEDVATSKLSEKDVLNIRDQCSCMTNVEIAELYPVTSQCIQAIRLRKIWRHI